MFVNKYLHLKIKKFFKLPGGNVDAKFTLNSITGELSMDSLDREIVSKYILTIIARDNGQKNHETYCNLTIFVLDDNDNKPIFKHNQYSNFMMQYIGNVSEKINENDSVSKNSHNKLIITIPENIPIETSIIQVKAIDYDQGINSKIIYSISEEVTWIFQIDNLTGIISTTG